MGKWFDRLFPPIPAAQPDRPIRVSRRPGQSFAVGEPGTTTYATIVQAVAASTSPINRDVLMAIPAFRSGVTRIAGIAGSMPYHAINSAGDRVPTKLLDQPERLKGYTRSVTFTRTAEDLLLEGASLWVVTDRDSTGFPTSVERIPNSRWDQDVDTAEITVDGEKIPAKDVRLFTAPFAGLAKVAGPTVQMYRQLRALTLMYAESPQAREYLKETEGLDMPDEEIEELLADWTAKRQAGVTAFLPMGLDLEQVAQMTPEQLTLNGANEWIVTEVARLLCMEPTWLGVNVTTRTYSNIIDERRNFIDFALMPQIIRHIEERLSLDDCVPHGQMVRASLDSFLRADTLSRYGAHQIGLTNGFLTLAEVRDMENRPPLPEAPDAA